MGFLQRRCIRRLFLLDLTYLVVLNPIQVFIRCKAALLKFLQVFFGLIKID